MVICCCTIAGNVCEIQTFAAETISAGMESDPKQLAEKLRFALGKHFFRNRKGSRAGEIWHCLGEDRWLAAPVLFDGAHKYNRVAEAAAAC